MEPEVVGKRVEKLLEKNKIKIEEFAQKMGIGVEVLQKKLKGEEEFYLDEMIKIKDIFQLDTKSCDELFFYKEIKNNNK